KQTANLSFPSVLSTPAADPASACRSRRLVERRLAPAPSRGSGNILISGHRPNRAHKKRSPKTHFSSGSKSRACLRLSLLGRFGAGEAFHFNLLTPHLVPQSLHTICSLLLNHDFFHEMGRLRHHRFFGCLADFNGFVSPVDVPRTRIRNSPANHARVLFMQGYFCFDWRFCDETANTGCSFLDQSLTDIQLLFRQAYYL